MTFFEKGGGGCRRERLRRSGGRGGGDGYVESFHHSNEKKNRGQHCKTHLVIPASRGGASPSMDPSAPLPSFSPAWYSTPLPPTAQKCNTLIACSLPCNSPTMLFRMKQHTPASKSDPTVASSGVLLILSPGAFVVVLLRVAFAPFPSDTSATGTRGLGNAAAFHHVLTCDSCVRCFDLMLRTPTAAFVP